jgi:hypothetical protein
MSIDELTREIIEIKQGLLGDQPMDAQAIVEQQESLRECIAALEAALALPTPYGFPNTELGEQKRKEAERVLGVRREELADAEKATGAPAAGSSSDTSSSDTQ